MIDRLELKTSQHAHFIESRNKSIPKGISQLIEEDCDIIELKRNDLNPLYRNAITHTILATDGEPHDDPVKFYIFSDPRFKKQQTDRYKIVLNPNKTPAGELLHFLNTNFTGGPDIQELFLEGFKIGRIDFNLDIETHTVHELFKLIFFDNKTQKHTAIFTDPLDADLELDTRSIRTIGGKEMETFYIGKGMYVLRIYDKVKEARHRIAVLKGQGITPTRALLELAEKKLVTRIELQIRDLNRAGIQKVNTRTGETNLFIPRKEIHNIRTLADLFKIQRRQFDIFSDIKFRPKDVITLHRETKRASAKQRFLNQPWIIDSFNALIDIQGFDNAMKKLDSDIRREVKRRHIVKEFQHNLDEECFKSIRKWINNI